MTIRAVVRAYDSEFSAMWPFGTPLTARLTAQLAAAGYNVTAIDAHSGSSVEILLSVVYPVTVTIAMQATTGPTDTANVTQLLRSIVVSATGYPPASIAITSAGQIAPVDPPSSTDSFFDNIGSFLNAITAGTSILTWAIVIGGVVLVYQVAKSPGAARKWIA